MWLFAVALGTLGARSVALGADSEPPPFDNHYEALGFSIADGMTKSTDDLRKAFKQRSMLFHPDKQLTREEPLEEKEANAKFGAVKDAWDALQTEEKRHQYHQELRFRTGGRSSAGHMRREGAGAGFRPQNPPPFYPPPGAFDPRFFDPNACFSPAWKRQAPSAEGETELSQGVPLPFAMHVGSAVGVLFRRLRSGRNASFAPEHAWVALPSCRVDAQLAREPCHVLAFSRPMARRLGPQGEQIDRLLQQVSVRHLPAQDGGPTLGFQVVLVPADLDPATQAYIPRTDQGTLNHCASQAMVLPAYEVPHPDLCGSLLAHSFAQPAAPVNFGGGNGDTDLHARFRLEPALPKLTPQTDVGVFLMRAELSRASACRYARLGPCVAAGWAAEEPCVETTVKAEGAAHFVVEVRVRHLGRDQDYEVHVAASARHRVGVSNVATCKTKMLALGRGQALVHTPLSTLAPACSGGHAAMASHQPEALLGAEAAEFAAAGLGPGKVLSSNACQLGQEALSCSAENPQAGAKCAKKRYLRVLERPLKGDCAKLVEAASSGKWAPWELATRHRDGHAALVAHWTQSCQLKGAGTGQCKAGCGTLQGCCCARGTPGCACVKVGAFGSADAACKKLGLRKAASEDSCARSQ